MKTHPRLAAKVTLALPVLVASALLGGTGFADEADGKPSDSADEKAACIAAASRGQTLRDSHSLLEAREQFRVCARQVCPAIVQTDCGPWLDDVERRTPSVVLSARDGDGRDLLDVSVSVDGAPLAQKLDGQAVPVNPGVHSFQFALRDGASATSRVIVKEGEKAQAVSVVLRAANALAPGEPVVVPPPADARSFAPLPAPAGKAARVAGVVLGGVGIVGVGVGIGVALDAKSKDVGAASEPVAARQMDSHNAVNQGNVATVVLVTGAVVAAAGVVLWVTAPRAKVAVGTDGGQVLLRGTF